VDGTSFATGCCPQPDLLATVTTICYDRLDHQKEVVIDVS
jgi:hypothetical protein